jgi:hypothetical protein
MKKKGKCGYEADSNGGVASEGEESIAGREDEGDITGQDREETAL